MSITLAGIVAKERWEGYRKGRTDRGPFVQKEYDVPYASGDAFVDAVMGGVSVSGGIGGVITYLPRHACPENPTLCATDASYEGLAETSYTGGTTPQFLRAIVKVTYGVLSWDQSPTADPKNSFPNSTTPNQPYTYAQCEIDFATEAMALPSGGYKYTGGLAIEDSKHHKTIGTATLRYLRKKVPYLPTELILSKMNRVNSTTIFGATAGKVLFKDGKTRREASSDGTAAQEVELVFAWREYSWNHLFNPASGAFAAVETTVGANPIYESTDLNVLLK